MFRKKDEEWIEKLKDPQERESYFKFNTFAMLTSWIVSVIFLVVFFFSNNPTALIMTMMFLFLSLMHHSEIKMVRLFFSVLKDQENYNKVAPLDQPSAPRKAGK